MSDDKVEVLKNALSYYANKLHINKLSEPRILDIPTYAGGSRALRVEVSIHYEDGSIAREALEKIEKMQTAQQAGVEK